MSFCQLFCLFIQSNVHILSCSHYFNQSLLVFSGTSIRILFLTFVNSSRSLFMFSLNSSNPLNLFIIVLLSSVTHILCKFFFGDCYCEVFGEMHCLSFSCCFILGMGSRYLKLGCCFTFSYEFLANKDRILTQSSRLGSLAES